MVLLFQFGIGPFQLLFLLQDLLLLLQDGLVLRFDLLAFAV